MIKYIKGDLLTTNAYVIVHGCNCQGVMGSGVAKAIRDKYPEVYKEYRRIYNNNGNRLSLGHIIPVHANKQGGKFSELGLDYLIINAMTQRHYGRDGKRYVSYDAISNCLQVLDSYLRSEHTSGGYYKNAYTIAMPKIGCGLGGGDWSIVEKIVEKELEGFQVEVYEL